VFSEGRLQTKEARSQEPPQPAGGDQRCRPEGRHHHADVSSPLYTFQIKKFALTVAQTAETTNPNKETTNQNKGTALE